MLIQLNKLAKLHDGHKVFFFKTNYLDQAFRHISRLRHKVILITGNCDYEINDDTVSSAPSNIKHWYAQNANTTKINGAPIGLENHENCIIDGYGDGHQHAVIKIDLLSKTYEQQPTKELYANFALSTNSVRTYVYDICRSLDYVTCRSVEHHQANIRRDFEPYLFDILDHRMIVCPEGNGVDCHRVWESLYLNRIPIVKESTVMNHFRELPIIFLDDWEQLRDLDCLNKKYEDVKKHPRTLLDINYWIDKITREKSLL